MCGNWIITSLAVVLVVSASSVNGALSLQYEGSYNLPNTSVFGTDYYAHRTCYVPDGNPRPGYGGPSEPPLPAGPSLVVFYDWGGNVVEYNNLPAPSTNAGALPVATYLPPASGGTTYNAGGGASWSPDSVDANGDFWDGNDGTAAFNGMASDPGLHVLGVTSKSPTLAVKETGWGGISYPLGGVLRRGDGSGGDLTNDGTAVGARFLHASRDYNRMIVKEATRVDATTMVSDALFSYEITGFADAEFKNEYVRSTINKEYHIVWEPGGYSPTSFVLDFYDASIGVGSGPPDYVADPTPVLSYDVLAAIQAVDPALVLGGRFRDAVVVWDAGQILVIEDAYKNTRVHVFSAVPEPATMGLLGVGLALTVCRRRRRG